MTKFYETHFVYFINTTRQVLKNTRLNVVIHNLLHLRKASFALHTTNHNTGFITSCWSQMGLKQTLFATPSELLNYLPSLILLIKLISS